MPLRTQIGKSPGLLQALFDVSFQEFVSLRLLPLSYALWLGLGGLFALMFIAGAVNDGVLMFFGTLLATALGFSFYLLFVRLAHESMAVLFRVADRAREVAEHSAAIAINTELESPRTSAPL